MINGSSLSIFSEAITTSPRLFPGQRGAFMWIRGAVDGGWAGGSGGGERCRNGKAVQRGVVAVGWRLAFVTRALQVQVIH